MPDFQYVILTGLLMGTVARFYHLRIDFRQYPSYPQGYVIHLTLGAIAAGLGSIVVPAIIDKEFAAVTFLAIAIQQFRDIRNMERQSLSKIEEDELVKRGNAYIEDIAKKFESRNYISMITGTVTTLAIYIFKNIIPGILAGFFVLFFLKAVMRHKKIRDVAHVKQAKVAFDGPFLKVDDIVCMNVALKEAREKILKMGMGVMIIPKDDDARVTLSNLGQRQAILHDIVSILGIRRELDDPEFMPIARRDSDNGYVGIVVLTMEPDIECLIELVKNIPVLESSRKQPLGSKIGRIAAD